MLRRATPRSNVVFVVVATVFVLTLVFSIPLQLAEDAARAVQAGDPVGPVRLGVPVLAIHADPVTVEPAGKPGDSPAAQRLRGRKLLYLGQSGGTVLLYDALAQSVIYVPATSIVLYVANCRGEWPRPPPPACETVWSLGSARASQPAPTRLRDAPSRNLQAGVAYARRIGSTWETQRRAPLTKRYWEARKHPATPGCAEVLSANGGSRGDVMSVDGQPPMVDEQAIIMFLRQLDRALSTALHGDEPQRRRRLTLTHTLVMAVLADPRHLDQALRQAADGLAHLDS